MGKRTGGGGRTDVLTNGKVFEKAGVNFSHVHGESLLPLPRQQDRNSQAAVFRQWGCRWSSIPKIYVPTSHANVRFFMAEKPGRAGVVVRWRL